MIQLSLFPEIISDYAIPPEPQEMSEEEFKEIVQKVITLAIGE